jgi:hypothetical protein
MEVLTATTRPATSWRLLAARLTLLVLVLLLSLVVAGSVLGDGRAVPGWQPFTAALQAMVAKWWQAAVGSGGQEREL